MYHSKNLEIHVIDHCNLDCVGCSHESPLMPRRAEDPDRLAEALTALWRHYRTRLVKLLGGEPLLHPRLDNVIHAIRSVTNARIRAVTNGTLLRRRYRQLRHVDEIHISRYPSVSVPADNELREIARELGVPITVQGFNAFRWHRATRHHDRNLTKRIFQTCQLYHCWQCHTVRDAWFYACPPAATWRDTDEGVDLLNSCEDIPSALNRLLSRQEPFAACNSCMGSAGQLFAHRRGWRTGSAGPSVPAIDEAFLAQLEREPDALNSCYEYQRTFHPSGEIELHVPS